MDTNYDAVVLGAGMSGLVSASILLDQGSRHVLVMDEYDHVGGNHIDHTSEHYTFDVGSFIFQDDSPLLRHFPEILPRYVPIEPTWGRLNPQGVITRYPFSVQDDFLAAGPLECVRILLSAIRARICPRRLTNARDFARYWIGARLFRRSGLEHYMERFCGLPTELIDLEFAEKRMLWISEYASVANLLRRYLARPTGSSPEPRRNQQLARPREGFAHLYQPAVRRLEDAGVTFLLGTTPRRIARSDQGFCIELADRSVATSRLISTVPVDRALALCDVAPEKHLPTVTLLSLFFSFAGRRGFDESILYNFSHEGAWKRLTTYSDFYGQSGGRAYFAVEVIADHVQRSVDLAERDFRQHVARNGLFTGDLRLEGSRFLANAYPIYTGGAGERAAGAVSTLRAWGIESFGRQGAFTYQPTARVSAIEAEAALGHR